jgi:peptidoglycan/xylan/chitin deacetylase (PgdA/CDA1 family)
MRAQSRPGVTARVLGHLRRRLETWVGRPQPIILMYHRVADLAIDPWSLAVTPAHFTEQIAWLVSVRDVVPLEQLGAGGGGRPRAAVTFDDGYADVLENAVPVLERFDCPATMFLTTGMIGSGREFWWDELSRLFLEEPVSQDFVAVLPDNSAGWRFRPGMTMREREAAHLAAWALLRPLSAADGRRATEALAAQFGVALQSRAAHRVMTADEIAACAGGILSFGAHAVGHGSLPALPAHGQRDEIVGSRLACAELTGSLPTSFAYPYGDFDATTARLAREAGFDRAVTVNDGVVRPKTSPWQLPRIGVTDVPGTQLRRRIP